MFLASKILPEEVLNALDSETERYMAKDISFFRYRLQERLFEKLENQKPQLLARFEEGYFEDEDIASLEETLTEMTR